MVSVIVEHFDKPAEHHEVAYADLPRQTLVRLAASGDEHAAHALLDAVTASGATFDYDPEKHPKGPDGRFIETGGSSDQEPHGRLDRRAIFAMNRRRWEKHGAPATLDWFAKYHDLTPEAYRKLAAEHVADEIGSRVIAVQEPVGVALKILDGDQFKNQFETHTSNGYIDAGNESRYEKERELFGISTTASSPEDHPIYGSMAMTERTSPLDGPGGVHDGRAHVDASAPIGQYGDVMFVMKDSVRERTTWTETDSLGAASGQTVGNVAHPGLDGLNADGDHLQYHDPLGDDLGHKNGMNYIEAQVHGPTSLKDVAAIYVDLPERSKLSDGVVLPHELRAKLAASGIPWFARGDRQPQVRGHEQGDWVPGRALQGNA